VRPADRRYAENAKQKIMPKTKFFQNINDLTTCSVEEIIRAGNQAIAEKDLFTVALSGGSTPKHLFKLLSTPEYSKQLNWSKVHIFWGDDRCVPPDHDDSNYKAANDLLLSKIEIPESNIHRVKGELASPSEIADQYEQEIRNLFDCGSKESQTFPCFDLIILGMGNDGHTASLFPDNKSGLEEKSKLVISVPPPSTASPMVPRVTFTFPVINTAFYHICYDNLKFLVRQKFG